MPQPASLPPTGRWASFLALAGGMLLPFAFAPFAVWPLAILLPALLLWLWQGQSPRRAAWLGLLFGLGLYSVGISWVYVSLHHYGHAPVAFAALATLLLILLMALYPALTGYLLARWGPRPGPACWLLAVPALWALLEWVRSWLFTGFPWLALGYSQIDSPLGGLASSLGVFGVSWAVMVSAGLLLLLIQSNGRGRLLWGGAGLILWAGAWVLGQAVWTEPAGDRLRISLVQGNIAQDQKFEPGELARTLRLYLDLSRQAAANSAVIIWPETAIPIFYQDAQEFIDYVQAEARRTGVDFMIGVPSGSWDTGVFHNSIISLGRSVGFYHKRRLLPFGEYLPARFVFNIFHRFVDIPMADFSSGRADQALLQVAGYPVGTSICFEAVFGSEIRLSLPEASFLVNVSNDAWFGDSLAPHQHLQIARMRAREAERYMARATNTGISAIIDSRGRVTARSGLFRTEVLQGEVGLRRGATPYVRLGDGLTVTLLAGLLGLALVRRPQTGYIKL